MKKRPKVHIASSLELIDALRPLFEKPKADLPKKLRAIVEANFPQDWDSMSVKERVVATLAYDCLKRGYARGTHNRRLRAANELNTLKRAAVRKQKSTKVKMRNLAKLSRKGAGTDTLILGIVRKLRAAGMPDRNIVSKTCEELRKLPASIIYSKPGLQKHLVAMGLLKK